jgi:hypothetical protein
MGLLNFMKENQMLNHDLMSTADWIKLMRRLDVLEQKWGCAIIKTPHIIKLKKPLDK